MTQVSRTTKRLERLAGALIRFKLPLFLLAMALTGLAHFPASKLSFDQSIESLYAEDNIRIQEYRRSKQWFGGDEFVIVAYTDPDLFSPEGLERNREFSHRLAKVKGVRQSSVQNLADALAAGWQVLTTARRERLKDLFRGVLFGDDEQTTAIVMRLEPKRSHGVPRSETIGEIRRLAAEQPYPVYVVGEPVQIYDTFRYLDRDGTMLFSVSLGVLSGVMLLFFRSLRWVALPLLVVLASINWTKAILYIFNAKLSMVSSILTSLVTIIGIATVTHVTVHYRELRREKSREDAFRQMFVDLAPAVFWTCATTAAGFAALLSSHVTPVRSFATMMALATLMVLVAVVMILPGGILLGRFGADPKSAPTEGKIARFLERTVDWVDRRPIAVSSTLGLLFVFAALGLLRLTVQTDFSKNFRDSSPIIQSLNFVEARLGGAGNWEVNFPAPAELSEEYLDRVSRVAEQLRGMEGNREAQITKVVALTDGLDLIPNVFVFRSKGSDRIAAKLWLLSKFQPEFASALYRPNSGRMRIMLRAKERQQADTKLKLIQQVRQLVQQEFPDAEVAGLYVLLAFLIDSLLDDQIVSFLWAAAGIGGMMSVAFRSLRIGVASLVPNVFPIVLVIGTMGWLDIPINIGTAMIASVSMGLTVDSTIHYIFGFRRARARGLDFLSAIRETHQGAGRAVVLANIALVIGFVVLSLSHFIPLVYFGVLVSVAMIGGVAINLVLLPLLLRWATRPDAMSSDPEIISAASGTLDGG